MSAFDVINLCKGSRFASDSTFQSPQYRRFLSQTSRAGMTDRGEQDAAWPAYRDAQLAAIESAPRVPRKLRGHAELPLNLPGSRPHPFNFNDGV